MILVSKEEDPVVINSFTTFTSNVKHPGKGRGALIGKQNATMAHESKGSVAENVRYR